MAGATAAQEMRTSQSVVLHVQDLSDEEPEERPAAKQKVGRKALVLSDSDDE